VRSVASHAASALRRILLATVAAVSLAAPAQEKIRIMGPAAPEAGFARTAKAIQRAMTASGVARDVEVYFAPGDGGLAGLTRFVKEARGDGTQLMVTGYTTIGSVLVNKSPVTFDDVTPIARLTAHVPFGFLVAAASPIENIQQLAAALKADPSKVAWVAGSVGGAGHTAVVMFAQMNQVDPARLNFTVLLGGGAHEAVLSGKATVALSTSYSAYEKEVKAGRLRLIGITSPQRRPDIDAPTLTEQGFPLVFENWRGVVAAPGITAVQRQVLADAVERMARSAAWKEILKENSWGDAYLGGAAFEEFLKSETARVERALRAAGMLK
jgi:putative tricarboxylic transport membrane protein